MERKQDNQPFLDPSSLESKQYSLKEDCWSCYYPRLIISDQYTKPPVFKSMTKYCQCSKPVPVATALLPMDFPSKPRRNSLNYIFKNKSYPISENNVPKETTVIYQRTNKLLT